MKTTSLRDRAALLCSGVLTGLAIGCNAPTAEYRNDNTLVVALPVGTHYTIPLPREVRSVSVRYEQRENNCLVGSVNLNVGGQNKVQLSEYAHVLREGGWDVELAAESVSARSVQPAGAWVMLSRQGPAWRLQVSCFADK